MKNLDFFFICKQTAELILYSVYYTPLCKSAALLILWLEAGEFLKDGIKLRNSSNPCLIEVRRFCSQLICKDLRCSDIPRFLKDIFVLKKSCFVISINKKNISMYPLHSALKLEK